MNISLTDFQRLVTIAVDAGIQGYLKSRKPQTDRIKQSEAKRFLVEKGYQATALKRWVEAGLITPVKKGNARNAAVWYSFTEIKKTLLVVELKKKDNDNS